MAHIKYKYVNPPAPNSLYIYGATFLRNRLVICHLLFRSCGKYIQTLKFPVACGYSIIIHTLMLLPFPWNQLNINDSSLPPPYKNFPCAPFRALLLPHNHSALQDPNEHHIFRIDTGTFYTFLPSFLINPTSGIKISLRYPSSRIFFN